MGKTVALVGFGDSRVEIEKYVDQIDEIWSLNNAEDYNLPRLDRLFDLHPLDRLVTYPRWKNITRELPYPVYLMEEHKDVPQGIRYPIEHVLEEAFKHIYVEEKRAKYLTSTFPYMVALAV